MDVNNLGLSFLVFATLAKCSKLFLLDTYQTECALGMSFLIEPITSDNWPIDSKMNIIKRLSI